MAYINYENFNNMNNSKNVNESNPSSAVGFFSLKNDGDEAIVRFIHDDTNSFEILGTHAIQLNGKFRRINCIRTPMQPVSSYPFCDKGENIDYRFFIHLLQYVKNPDGSVSAEPKVWERSMSYANKMKEYINNYGPMSDVICKIVRHGKPGDMKTEYEIIPNLNKQIYRDDIFVKRTDYFDDYKSLGRVVLDKNVDEIKEYLTTGNFPVKNNNEEIKKPVEQNNNTFMNEPSPWPVVETTDDLPKWSVETTTTSQPSRNFNWTTNDSQQVNRPTRF